jgi:hypothetical protein
MVPAPMRRRKDPHDHSPAPLAASPAFACRGARALLRHPLTEGVSRPRGNLAIAHDNRRSCADRHLDPGPSRSAAGLRLQIARSPPGGTPKLAAGSAPRRPTSAERRIATPVVPVDPGAARRAGELREGPAAAGEARAWPKGGKRGPSPAPGRADHHSPGWCVRFRQDLHHSVPYPDTHSMSASGAGCPAEDRTRRPRCPGRSRAAARRERGPDRRPGD